MANLSVLGAGAWGTVIASLLANNGHFVSLWTRRPDHAQDINIHKENKAYVPGLKLDNVVATSELESLSLTQAVFVAVPSKGLGEVLAACPDHSGFISCSKGLEFKSFKRFSQIIQDYKPFAKVAALSGPNLAKEIALGLPAAATIASKDMVFAKTVQAYLNQARFRVYSSDDIIGLEIAGALKNVIALAAGISDGLHLGDNAKATLITRGLNEMVKVGLHLGGDLKTFYGLSGLGDLVATCSSGQSRNHSAGEQIAKGARLADLEASQLTAEGIPTTRAVYELALREGLELPICSEIYKVIYQNKSPQKAISDLMGRDMKME
jgi:glycerol-3-phosphate dehydrogenase (NAD(P)+)